MLYENYQKKIQKVAAILTKIVRKLPLIIAITAAVIAAVIAILSFKGSVGKLSCPYEVTYGDKLDCNARAFLSEVYYEYAENGSDNWATEYPLMPGEYKVRAVGTTIFGKSRYSRSVAYTVKPRTVTVAVAESEVLYGGELSISASLAYKDTIICGEIAYELQIPSEYQASIDLLNPTERARIARHICVTPKADTVTILDKNGNDVSHAYTLEFKTGLLAVLKRDISVVVNDSSQVYNGQRFTFDQYELRDGTLADGDTLTATFDAALEDVGSVVNAPMLTVFSAQGKDRTLYYNITESFGTLTVEKRPLIIHTPSARFEYDGKIHFFEDYKIDESTTLVEGHKLLAAATALKDSGSYKNYLSFTIKDEKQKDVSNNYSLLINLGEINIEPKHIVFATESGEWIYDANSHSKLDFTNEGLIEGHRVEINSATEITDFGVEYNMLDYDIFDENGTNVTRNYQIEHIYGTLTVLPRHIDVYTASQEWVYDGMVHNNMDCWATGLVDGHYIAPNTATPSLRDASIVGNEFTVSVFIDDGSEYSGNAVAKNNEVCSKNYSITYHYGTLEITKRPITVTTVDGYWIFDGEEHFATGFDITSPLGLADSEWAEVIDWEYIRNAGEIDNVYSVFKIWRYPYVDVTPYPIPPEVSPADEETTPPETEDDRTTWNNGYGDEYEETENIEIDYVDPLPPNGFLDVTHNYEITWVYGKLTVDPRPIVVNPVYAEKVYDDTALYASAVELSPESDYGLVEGHELVDPAFSGMIRDAGEATSHLVTVKVKNGSVDETDNYDIIPQSGILRVLPREITVYTGGARKIYDETPLTNGEYGAIPENPYSLIEGHELFLDVLGNQTEIGESYNWCDTENTKVTCGGRNVTRNYVFNYEFGILCVEPVAVIYVTSASDSKYYDGTPLENPDYKLVVRAGELLATHNVSVTVSGSITEVGKTENTVKAFVTDARGRDVSAWYKLVVVEGMLEIKSEQPQPPTHIHTLGKLKSHNGGYMYLRMDSYGNYNGNGWGPATPYWKTLPGGYSYNYLSSIAAANAGLPMDTVEIQELLIYMLPYYLAMSGTYEVPTSDVSYFSDLSEFICDIYNIAPRSDGYEYLKGKLGNFSVFEREYRAFVYDTYLEIDEDTRSYMRTLIGKQGFDISDPQVISKIASYIRNAAKYDLEYDMAMESEPNVAIAFLETYKRGICVHYASAATLLYRTLGIPARYVEGFALYGKAGEFVDIKTPGHAWVEVYIDSVGWIAVEVTPGSDDGESDGLGDSVEIDDTIEIKPTYQWKYYDGTALIAESEIVVKGALEDLVKNKGYSYFVDVRGEQTEVGQGISYIANFILYDPDGHPVTGNFDIKYLDGTLEVLPADQELIRVYLYQLQKYYDGTPLMYEDLDYEIIEIGEGLELELELDISLTDVGMLTLSDVNSEIDEYAAYKVYKNGVDVTAKYRLMFDVYDGVTSGKYVPIKIDKRAITVTAASQTKIFDSKPLENGKASITKGSLVEGHSITYYVSGYIDAIGSVENKIERVVILDSNGVDVTNNYDIEAISGILTLIEDEND